MERKTRGRRTVRPYRCSHYISRSTELKRILERIKSSSRKGFRCQGCNKVKRSRGRPPKKGKKANSGSTFHWVCLDCGENFCGGKHASDPDGHISEHALSDGHPLGTRLDNLSVWCFECETHLTTIEEEKNVEVESATDVKEKVKKVKGMKQQEVNNHLHYRHCTGRSTELTELKRILERIGSSSSKDFRCQECNKDVKRGHGRPPKERKESVLSTFHWVCLDCKENFCGGECAFDPDSHIYGLALKSGHTLVTPLDNLRKVWCFESDTLRPITTVEEKNVEVESAKDVKEKEKGTKQQEVNNHLQCSHYTTRITELSQMLERIKSSSNKDFRCQECCKDVKGSLRPSKKRKETVSESTFPWVCLDCKQNFCGVYSIYGPNGHILYHARNNDHHLVTRLDRLTHVWCFKCDTLLLITTEEVKNEEAESAISIREGTKRMEKQKVNNPVCKCQTSFRFKMLPNKENTCYLNSVLQNLFAMDRLRQCLAISDLPLGNTTEELKRLFTETCDDSKDTLNPQNLLDFLRKEGQFEPPYQYDSHELLGYLLEQLRLEGTSFVDEIFGGEFLSILCCAQCGKTSTKHEQFLDISLQVPSKIHLTERAVINAPKDNVPPVIKGDGDQKKGIARRSLIAEMDEALISTLEGNESSNPLSIAIPDTMVEAQFFNPFSIVVPVTMENILKPGSREVAGAPDSSDSDVPLSKLRKHSKRKRLQRKHGVSSSGKADAKVDKENTNESIMVSGPQESIGEDIKTDVAVGVWSGDTSNAPNYDEVCEVDNTNGPVSIERCLELFIEPEDLADQHCEQCSDTLQHQQPSEASDFEEDGVKSGSKKAPGSPRETSDQKNVGCDGHNLAAVPGTSQGQTETEQLSKDEDMETKCEEVKRKFTKRFLIKTPPPILTIHLKISQQMESGSLKKIERHIVFKETLDLTPYMDCRDEKYLYRLTGLVEHMGDQMTYGHYVAYVRGEQSQGRYPWFKANDWKIREVSLQEVLKRNAYILFYERI